MRALAGALALASALSPAAAFVAPSVPQRAASPRTWLKGSADASALGIDSDFTEAELAKLARGSPVAIKARDADGGWVGSACQDVAAPPDTVFDRIVDFENYNKMVMGVVESKNYYEEPTVSGADDADQAADHGTRIVKTKLVSQVLHKKLPCHFVHTLNEADRTMSFTLDPEKKSDLEQSDGAWAVHPHPDDPSKTRLFYSIKLKTALPTFIVKFMQEQAVTVTIAWVKLESEKLSKAAGPAWKEEWDHAAQEVVDSVLAALAVVQAQAQKAVVDVRDQVLANSSSTLTDAAGVVMVASLKGDANEVFDEIDADKNGVLDRDELKTFLGRMLFNGDRASDATGTGEPASAMAATAESVGLEDQDAWRILTDDHVELLAREIDTENDGTEITKATFAMWYKGYEEKIREVVQSAGADVYVEGLQEEVSAASANAAESIRMTADTLALNSQASKKMIAMVQERVDAAQKEAAEALTAVSRDLRCGVLGLPCDVSEFTASNFEENLMASLTTSAPAAAAAAAAAASASTEQVTQADADLTAQSLASQRIEAEVEAEIEAVSADISLSEGTTLDANLNAQLNTLVNEASESVESVQATIQATASEVSSVVSVAVDDAVATASEVSSVVSVAVDDAVGSTQKAVEGAVEAFEPPRWARALLKLAAPGRRPWPSLHPRGRRAIRLMRAELGEVEEVVDPSAARAKALIVVGIARMARLRLVAAAALSIFGRVFKRSPAPETCVLMPPYGRCVPQTEWKYSEAYLEHDQKGGAVVAAAVEQGGVSKTPWEAMAPPSDLDVALRKVVRGQRGPSTSSGGGAIPEESVDLGDID